jgi:hypothetical protein
MLSLGRPAVAGALTILAVALMAAVPGGAMAKSGHKAKAHTFTGTVAAVAKDRRSFRLRRSGKSALRIRVARSTKTGKGAHVRTGQSLGVRARRVHGAWVATRISRLTNSTATDPASGADDPDPDLGEDDQDIEDDLDLDDLDLDPGDLLDPDAN